MIDPPSFERKRIRPSYLFPGRGIGCGWPGVDVHIGVIGVGGASEFGHLKSVGTDVRGSKELIAGQEQVESRELLRSEKETAS